MVRDDDLDYVYSLYGYEKKVYNNACVYEFKHGRYYGADIFPVGAQSITDILTMYQEQGFATVVKHISEKEKIEDDLFMSFFHVDVFKSILNRQYLEYTQKIEKRLANQCKYEYISGKYQELLIKMGDTGLALGEKEGRKDIIVEIENIINKYEESPLLTIIEAAAGYGKTCTAYELIHSFSQSKKQIIPLYIELARNREARIFKHILQNEIEKQFQNVVTSDLVLYQIWQGKIPVIIDGFDELLSKDFEADATKLRDVESMLSTILELLTGKAKVIITTRKTAILNGDSFYDSVNESEKKFILQRITLESPEISDWLTPAQLELYKQTEDADILSVANPVLLSYFRSMSSQDFHSVLKKEVSIVELYFKAMLNREQERQNLSMSEETQKRIFRKLVRFMCEFDIKAESKALIKDLIRDYNENIFNDYIEHYVGLPKPTYDDLAETLSNHALLDRNKDNQVGFINDFILGILVAENIKLHKFVEHYPDNYRSILSQVFAELAIDSYKMMPGKERQILWTAFQSAQYGYDDRFELLKDLLLTGKLHKSTYQNFIIEDMSVYDVTFDGNLLLSRVIFSNVIFKRCHFSRNVFDDSGFINCSFLDCTWISDKDTITAPYLLGTVLCNNDFVGELEIDNHSESAVILSETQQIESKILSLFIRPEGRITGMKRVQLIRTECEGFPERTVNKVLGTLKNNKYIIINGGNCFIQQEGITYYNKSLKHSL